MLDVKVAKEKYITDRLIHKTSSLLDEIASKIMHKEEEGDR